MNKKMKIGFWISTGLLSAMMLLSSGMYIFNHETIAGLFESYGYPTYIIYPLAALKISGIAVLWFGPARIKEWAYAGFFFNFILAFFAHNNIGDGEQGGAAMALILLISSYYFNYKKENTPVAVA